MARARLVLAGFVLVIAWGLLAPAAEDDRAGRAADERAIKQIGVEWEAAWNRHDADALASLLADDVDFVTVAGPNGWLRGRQHFSDDHAAKHRTRFRDSVWDTQETQVRFLRPDLALARVLWRTAGDKVPHRKHGEPRQGVFMWVVEKRDGRWLIVASQNTEAMPPLPGQ